VRFYGEKRLELKDRTFPSIRRIGLSGRKRAALRGQPVNKNIRERPFESPDNLGEGANSDILQTRLGSGPNEHSVQAELVEDGSPRCPVVTDGRTADDKAGNEEARRKIDRVNPSKVITYALSSSEYTYALPHTSSGKTSIRPGKATTQEELDKPEAVHVPPKGMEEAPFARAKHPLNTNLQLIVASCIRALPCDDSGLTFLERWNNDPTKKFRKDVLDYLRKNGYTPHDVLDWCSVLTEKNSETTALHLIGLCNVKRTNEYRAVPTFVVLYLLRREQISAQGLQLLLRHSVDRVFRQHNSKYESVDTGVGPSSAQPKDQTLETAKYPSMGSETFVLLVLRLIRHARRVWPAGLPGIARLVTNYYVPSTSADASSQSYQSFIFNRLLQLLGLPSDQTPFLSVPYHQRAQFQLLHHMSKYDPPLTLNRDGYRAITRVQIAHRKSLPERDWAVIKSRSWPPYKQDRTGLDADIGIEHGISRARETLAKMNESGLRSDSWERSAMVLSGWDTDDSPTIQTRAIMSLRKGLVRTKHGAGETDFADANDIWPARIKATRTLDEAWATFLSYRQSTAPPSENAYHEMAMKVAFASMRMSKELASDSGRPHGAVEETTDLQTMLPGDGLEVTPPPRDPREHIYVHAPPPSLMSLVQSALSDGIILRGRFLAFLIQHAGTLDDCAILLRNSTLSQDTVSMLLGERTLDRSQLAKIPENVFASYIGLLSRSGHALPVDFSLSRVCDAVFEGEGGRLNHILLAFRLVLVLRPQYRPPWHALASALTEEITHFRGDKFVVGTLPRDVQLWNMVLDVVSTMQASDVMVDASMFRLLCVAFAKAGRASNGWIISNAQYKVQSKTDESLRHGLEQLKGIFRKLVSVGTDDGVATTLEESTDKAFASGQASINVTDIMPRVLEVPNPAQLHAFIRALGTIEDFDGLLELTKWMVRFAPEINTMKREAMNGHSQLRKCLVALRVYLEGDFVREIVASKDELTKRRFNTGQAPDELTQEVFDLVEQVDEWRGWPSDEEVERYCSLQPLPVRVMRKV
jgi:hypothetical protein